MRISKLAGIIAGIGGGASSGTSASRYSFMGTGFRWPSTSQSSATNTEFAVEFRFGTPDYATTDPIIFCPSFWSPTSPGEVYIASGTTITIKGWSVETSAGVWTACDGASDSGIASITNASAGAWLPKVTTTLTANTMYRARLIFSVNGTGLSIPRQTAFGATNSPGGQERIQGSTTTLFSLLTNNTALSNAGGISYKPAMMVAKGGDGRPAIFVTGDSISFGVSNNVVPGNWTSRNEFGYIGRALDSNSGSLRLGYFIGGVQGQRPFGVEGWNNPANWAGKLAAYQAIKDTYGQWPFDLIINQHITNALPNDNATIRTGMNEFYDLLATRFGKPVTQVECLAKTQSTDGYSTLGNETPIFGATYPVVDSSIDYGLWSFNADVGGPDGLGDASAYYRVNNKIADSIAPWRLIAADLANNRDIVAIETTVTTVATAYASGTTLVTTAALNPGASVNVLLDSGSWSAIRNVLTVTGTGPFTVTLDGALGGAAAVGRAVQEVWGDGVHPSAAKHAVLQNSVVAWKQARGFV